jgi:hypothetical protein
MIQMENPDKKGVCEMPGKGWEELYRDNNNITFWRRAGTQIFYNATYDVTSRLPVYQIIKRPSTA